MAYSCTDFTDSILEALGINVPVEFNNDTAEQAEAAIAEIRALQRDRADLKELGAPINESTHEWPLEEEEEDELDD
jgi:hypothetical protein